MKYISFTKRIILVPSATRLKMSLTSSPGRTKKFEFFHWLTKNGCAAETKITKLYASHLLPARMAASYEKKQNKWRPFLIDPKESQKFSRNQSSSSPATMSFSTVIIVFFCSSREGEKKRLKLSEFHQLTQRLLCR